MESGPWKAVQDEREILEVEVRERAAEGGGPSFLWTVSADWDSWETGDGVVKSGWRPRSLILREYYLILLDMSKPKFERISITLPAELLRWADQEAKRLGRSRSWVIAESLRGAGAAAGEYAPRVVSTRVAEPRVNPYAEVAGEMAVAEERRLRAALALSPEERLRQAEELIRLARAVRPQRRRSQIIAFDTFEEYWQWKRANQVAGAVRI
jgi:Ribbon-helix-helix protein, copG family